MEPSDDTPQLNAVATIMAAWREHDAETVLAQLADDVEFTYALGMRPAVGKDRVGRLLDALKANQQNVKWRSVNRAQTGSVVFVEAIDDYVNAKGHHVRTPHVTVFEFDGDKVSKWRDYFDMRSLEGAEEGQPISEWLEPLVADDRGAS